MKSIMFTSFFLLSAAITLQAQIGHDNVSTADSQDSIGSTADILQTSADDEDVLNSFTVSSEVEGTRVKKGLDLSAARSVAGTSFELITKSGLTLNGGWSRTLGSGGHLLEWNAEAGYMFILSGQHTLTFSLQHTKYGSDSINVLSGLQNAILTTLKLSFPAIDLTADYELYLGMEPAHYLTITIGKSIASGNFSFDGEMSLTYLRQSIDQGRLDALAAALKKKKSSAVSDPRKKISLSGFSELLFSVQADYALGKGFVILLTPEFSLSPKGEISAKKFRFLWSAGIEYRYEY